MVTWAPTWDKNQIEEQLKKYSTTFLKVWLSMMFYNSSKWLYRAYWDFVWKDWSFSKEKYEEYLDWIIKWIRAIDIKIPEKVDVKWILETDIEAFVDVTSVSWSISDLHIWTNSVDDDALVKEWIKAYYEEQMFELTWYSEPVKASIDNFWELVDEILWWLQLN